MTDAISRIAGLLALAVALTACGTDGGASGSPADAAADTGGDGADAADGSGASADADAGPDTAPIDPRDDGEPCVTDEDCAGGTCFGPADGFPGGFCTFADCESRRDCTGDERACLRGEFNGNLCVALCEQDADCREGYECVPTSGGAYCYPAFAGADLEPVCASDLIAAQDVDNPWSAAGRFDRHTFSFEVGPEATGFFLVAWDRRRRLVPDALIDPSGERVVVDDYASYWYTPYILETVSPLIVPGGPQFVDLVQPGTWQAEFGYEGGEDEDICWIVLEETAGLDVGDEPLVVDVNFYFVGVDGLSSRTAADDEDFQQMLDEFHAAYAQANISFADVRYLDVVGDVADRFSVIRSEDAMRDLVSLSRQPGERRTDLLSVNVFFVRGFSGDMSGTLGVSSGIPGVPGIHGSPGTGLVFSAGGLGSSRGNRTVGQTLAHELGHFLGLFHTTEQNNAGVDQLDDTPVCLDIGRGNPDCPDIENLMFPVAAWSGLAQITPGQALILRANPLTKISSRTELD